MTALKAEADRVMRDDDRVNPLGQVLDLDSGSFPKVYKDLEECKHN